MRLLVVSDTHGRLELIDSLVKKEKPDIVLHCGDFGFYDYTNIDNLPDRELYLILKHWYSFPEEKKKELKKKTREELEELVFKYRALGDFQDYLEGKREFSVPVVTVWGNHDDAHTVQKLLKGDYEVPNLFLLSADRSFSLTDEVEIFGLGGNHSLKHFFATRFSQHPFYLFDTAEEWVELYLRTKEAREKDKQVWLVTHVSPGKEQVLELFGFHIKPKFWFSGHMEVPLPQHYSLFTFIDDYEFHLRVEEKLRFTKKEAEDYLTELEAWVKMVEFLSGNQSLPEKTIQRALDRLHLKKNVRTRIEKAVESFLEGKNDLVYPPLSHVKEVIETLPQLLTVPFPPQQVNTKKEFFARKKSDFVKETGFFNLPDLEDGGYIVIDFHQNEGRAWFSMNGSLDIRTRF